MKVSTGWKIVLHVFAIILLIQGLDLGYYLMNQKDTYLANLGIILGGALFASMVYCIIQITIYSMKFIKEIEQKENKNQL